MGAGEVCFEVVRGGVDADDCCALDDGSLGAGQQEWDADQRQPVCVVLPQKGLTQAGSGQGSAR